eukprot:8125300-Pyramimonas_sp.AAC.3
MAAAFSGMVAPNTVVAASPVMLVCLHIEDVAKYVPIDKLEAFIEESELRDNWRCKVVTAAKGSSRNPVAQVLAETAAGRLSVLSIRAPAADNRAPAAHSSPPSSPIAGDNCDQPSC